METPLDITTILAEAATKANNVRDELAKQALLEIQEANAPKELAERNRLLGQAKDLGSLAEKQAQYSPDQLSIAENNLQKLVEGLAEIVGSESADPESLLTDIQEDPYKRILISPETIEIVKNQINELDEMRKVVGESSASVELNGTNNRIAEIEKNPSVVKKLMEEAHNYNELRDKRQAEQEYFTGQVTQQLLEVSNRHDELREYHTSEAYKVFIRDVVETFFKEEFEKEKYDDSVNHETVEYIKGVWRGVSSAMNPQKFGDTTSNSAAAIDGQLLSRLMGGGPGTLMSLQINEDLLSGHPATIGLLRAMQDTQKATGNVVTFYPHMQDWHERSFVQILEKNGYSDEIGKPLVPSNWINNPTKQDELTSASETYDGFLTKSRQQLLDAVAERISQTEGGIEYTQKEIADFQEQIDKLEAISRQVDEMKKIGEGLTYDEQMRSDELRSQITAVSAVLEKVQNSKRWLFKNEEEFKKTKAEKIDTLRTELIGYVNEQEVLLKKPVERQRFIQNHKYISIDLDRIKHWLERPNITLQSSQQELARLQSIREQIAIAEL